MTSLPTLLLLGGSRQQVVAIEKARECGYRTVLCDYLIDNPGQYVADKFHLVSTTDREAVLEVARAEDAEGVIAYSSDPAAPTAAFVAEKLGLPTNPLVSVEAMSVKTLFREHMAHAGLPCPRMIAISDTTKAPEVLRVIEGMHWPVVVKPTDSSGSKGVSVVRNPFEMESALVVARARGRNGVLIVEEYVERAFPNIVGGDVFVVDGIIRFWGLMSCLRDTASPLVPVGKKTPSGLSDEQLSASKQVLQDLVDSLGVRFGELNVEILIGEGDVPYVVELGARAGGNMIPVQLSDASGVDLVRANVMCAMGDDPGDMSWEPGAEFFATHVLHSAIGGVYGGFELSPEAKAACYREVIYQEPGSPVEVFDGADKALGILFFKFESQEQMDGFCCDVAEHVKVSVR